MVPTARWLVVAVVAVVVTALPLAPKLLPADQTRTSATQLAKRIDKAGDVTWSGEVRALGSVQIPLSGATFGGVARLLGEQTDLRVWWRGKKHYRIDRVRATGESDTVRDGGLTGTWNYESNRVSFSPYSAIRLPGDVDVVPAALADRLLDGARASELSRLPAVRVAGHSASGLRLVPADKRSTISRVDVWADDSTGLPLRVEVYADPSGAQPNGSQPDGGVPVLRTELVSLEMKTPTTAETQFRFSRSLSYARGASNLDAAAGANAYAPFTAPNSVAGLPRRGRAKDFGAVGVYGRGPTAVLAIPLRDFVARGLRSQLHKSSTSRDTTAGVSLEVGPLSVLLTRVRGGNFLLLGTVTAATLVRASGDVAAGVVRTR